jgi:hypothetical protein
VRHTREAPRGLEVLVEVSSGDVLEHEEERGGLLKGPEQLDHERVVSALGQDALLRPHRVALGTKIRPAGVDFHLLHGVEVAVTRGRTEADEQHAPEAALA